MVPRENKNNAYAKFGGTNKEYYGIFRSGLWAIVFVRLPSGTVRVELESAKIAHGNEIIHR